MTVAPRGLTHAQQPSEITKSISLECNGGEALREVLVVNFTFCGDFCSDFHYKSKSPQVLVVI